MQVHCMYVLLYRLGLHEDWLYHGLSRHLASSLMSLHMLGAWNENLAILLHSTLKPSINCCCVGRCKFFTYHIREWSSSVFFRGSNVAMSP